MPWYNYEYKEAKKLTRKARKQFIYALKLFDTLVTPISKYGIELSLQRSRKLEKQTYIFKVLPQ